jgi:uncharacterized protein (TIGR03085 family)
MSSARFARSERAALCDLLEQVGPDQPTLCEGWTTRDLAAHLVVRERRMDAAAGIVVRALADHAERVRRAEAARPFAQIVARARRPPAWSLAGVPVIDRLTNTGEFFIHHEDVRRGTGEAEPRPLDPELGAMLFGQIKATIGLRLRRFPAQITVEAPGFGTAAGGAGGPAVTLTGDPGELTLFLSGRQEAARVSVDGPPELVSRLCRARLGV